jgi:hypothetical protein
MTRTKRAAALARLVKRYTLARTQARTAPRTGENSGIVVQAMHGIVSGMAENAADGSWRPFRPARAAIGQKALPCVWERPCGDG